MGSLGTLEFETGVPAGVSGRAPCAQPGRPVPAPELHRRAHWSFWGLPGGGGGEIDHHRRPQKEHSPKAHTVPGSGPSSHTNLPGGTTRSLNPGLHPVTRSCGVAFTRTISDGLGHTHARGTPRGPSAHGALAARSVYRRTLGRK